WFQTLPVQPICSTGLTADQGQVTVFQGRGERESISRRGIGGNKLALNSSRYAAGVNKLDFRIPNQPEELLLLHLYLPHLALGAGLQLPLGPDEGKNPLLHYGKPLAAAFNIRNNMCRKEYRSLNAELR